MRCRRRRAGSLSGSPAGIRRFQQYHQFFRFELRGIDQRIAVARCEQRELAAGGRRTQPRAQRIDGLRLQHAHQRRETHFERRPLPGRGVQRPQRFAGTAFGVQRIELRQHARQRAAVMQYRKHRRRRTFHQPFGELLPDALGHQRIGLAGLHHLHHQRLRLRGDGKAEARRKPRHPQDAHRILGECRADMAQHAAADIFGAVARVDQPSRLVARQRVDGQVAALQVLLQRDVGRGVESEAVVARRGFALGARQRVLFVGLRMQEHRKIAPDRTETQPHHLLRRCADHDMIAVLHRQAEQFIAHRAADHVGFHDSARQAAQRPAISRKRW